MRHLFLSIAIALFAFPVMAEKLYVHLKAFERHDRVTVEMTLPLTLVSKAAEFLSEADLRGSCRVNIDDHDFDLDEMHRVAERLRRGEDGLVEISSHEELRFRRMGDEVEIVAEDDWDEVVTRIPAELFFAAFRDDDTVDFRAALDILAARGGGELLASTAEDGRVRVWVDGSKSISGGAR